MRRREDQYTNSQPLWAERTGTANDPNPSPNPQPLTALRDGSPGWAARASTDPATRNAFLGDFLVERAVAGDVDRIRG